MKDGYILRIIFNSKVALLYVNFHLRPILKVVQRCLQLQLQQFRWRLYQKNWLRIRSQNPRLHPGRRRQVKNSTISLKAWVIAIYSNILIDRYPPIWRHMGWGGTPIHESSLFIVIVHSFKPHLAWVIAINSNSTLPNDVMSRQGLIDMWGGTFLNMFEGGTSPLLIVRVRTLRPENGWVIAIFSNRCC